MARGGKRPGAGRKTDSPRVTLSVRVTGETREALDRLRAQGESTGQLIDRLVKNHTREG